MLLFKIYLYLYIYMYHIVSFNLSKSSSSCIFSFDVSPPFKIGTCRVCLRSGSSLVVRSRSRRFVRRRARNYHHYLYWWHRPAVAVLVPSRPIPVVWETIPRTMTTVRRYRLLRVAAVARAAAAAAGTPVAAAHTAVAVPVAVTPM